MDNYTTMRVQDAIANYAVPRPELLDFSGADLYEISGVERIVQDDYMHAYMKEVFTPTGDAKRVMFATGTAMAQIKTAFGTFSVVEDPYAPKEKLYTMSGVRGAISVNETPFLKLRYSEDEARRLFAGDWRPRRYPYLMEHLS